MKLEFFITVILVFFIFSSYGGKIGSEDKVNDKQKNINILVEKRLESMTMLQKINQLFLIRAHSDKGDEYVEKLAKEISMREVGGLVFFQGTPKRQLELTHKFNKNLTIPLLISMDAEWGLNMRLENTIALPFGMTLGAVQDVDLVRKSAFEIGKQLKSIGVQINFAPVVDINNNPENPVIGIRSFGDDKKNVTQRALAYMEGLSEAGIIPVAKHFPGHGDTHVDSHYALPRIRFSRKRLDTLELYPFKALIAAGLPAIMTAHINVSSYDRSRRLPATLSKNINQKLLRGKLNFKGLIITDAMEMEGVKKYFRNGNAELRALRAGSDLICLPEDIDKATSKILQAVKKGRLTKNEINQKVRKVLFLKYNLGLFSEAIPDTTDIGEKLMSKELIKFKQKVCDVAVTLLNFEGRTLVDQSINKTSTLIVSMVNSLEEGETIFQQETSKLFTNAHTFTFSIKPLKKSSGPILEKINQYKTIIFAVHDTRRFPRKTYLKNDKWDRLIQFILSKSVTNIFFGSPYILNDFINISNQKNILICYENSDEMNISAAKVIRNEITPKGRLPVTINKVFRTGSGY